MSRGKLADPFEQGLLAGHIQESQKSVDDLGSDLSVDRRIRQDRFDLGSEDQRRIVQAIVERLDSNPVSRQKQSLRVLIPDGEGKHSAQLLQTLGPELLVQMDDHFRVALRLENVALCSRETYGVPDSYRFLR